MPRKSHQRHQTSKSEEKGQEKQRPESPVVGPVESDAFERVGPLSSEGVEARDLPDKGRGGIETEQGHEGQRTLPQQSGSIEQEGGMHASLDISDADRHGHDPR